MVTRAHFGTLPDGTSVDIITIRNARGFELSALTYGCLIVAVKVPEKGLRQASKYSVVMGFMGVRASIPCAVLEWEPPWRARIRLGGVLNATVTTSIASLPFDRSLLRHQIDYVFRGPLGAFAAASVNAVGGAQYALKRGTLAQKKEIEARAAAR